MHDGRFATLEEVIDHYDHGMVYSPTLADEFQQDSQPGLRLTSHEKARLMDFLETLSDYEMLTDPLYAQ